MVVRKVSRMKCVTRFVKDQAGLATIEYALLLAFIGLSVAVAMATLAGAVGAELDRTSSDLSN